MNERSEFCIPNETPLFPSYSTYVSASPSQDSFLSQILSPCLNMFESLNILQSTESRHSPTYEFSTSIHLQILVPGSRAVGTPSRHHAIDRAYGCRALNTFGYALIIFHLFAERSCCSNSRHIASSHPSLFLVPMHLSVRRDDLLTPSKSETPLSPRHLPAHYALHNSILCTTLPVPHEGVPLPRIMSTSRVSPAQHDIHQRRICDY